MGGWVRGVLRICKGGTYTRSFKKFCWVPMDCLWSWIGMLIRMGRRNVLVVGFVRSQLSMCFMSVHHDSQIEI